MKNTYLLLLTFFTISQYAQPVMSIPFTVEKNTIYIYAKVNESDSLKFIFDTGADGSVINQLSLHKVKLHIDGKTTNIGSNGSNEVDHSSKNELKLGNLTQKELFLTIIPFGTDSFDGVLGTDIMQNHIIEIDYHKQMLHFYAQNDKSINYKGFTKMKMHSASFYPTFIKSALVINGKKYAGLFGLDTGADDALIITTPFGKKNKFINKMIKIGAASFQGSDGAIVELPIVLCPEIQFANKSFYQIHTALSTATEGADATDKLAGFYGNAFLKKFNLILDYRNKFIYFKLNKNLYTGFYDD